MRRIIESLTPPENKQVMWLDISGKIKQLKVYINDEWEVVNDDTENNAEIVNKVLKKIDKDFESYIKKEDADNTYATKAALNKKVDVIEGKGLSTEDFTSDEKTKLAGIDEKSLLSFNGIAINDANKALRSGIYPSVTKNVPINGESFTIQTLRTTTAVYNQFVSTQIAIGTTGTAIGKVYIRKNTQGSGAYTFGDWICLSVNLTTGSVTYANLSPDALNGIQNYVESQGVPSEIIPITDIENLFK